jgi:hypothetical protein
MVTGQHFKIFPCMYHGVMGSGVMGSHLFLQLILTAGVMGSHLFLQLILTEVALTCEYVKNDQIPSYHYSNHNARSHYFGQKTACIVFLFKNKRLNSVINLSAEFP